MGKPIQGLKFKEMRPIRRDMQIVFQDPYGSLSPRMSVADIVDEGLKIHQPELSEDEREQRVVHALTDVGLDPETRFRYPHEFSGGQRQRIAVARAIVLRADIRRARRADHRALDMLIQSQIVDLLRDLQKRRDLTYLFISHDLRVVAALASRLVGDAQRQGGGRRARGRVCSRIRRPTIPARCSPPRSISKPPPTAWWRSDAVAWSPDSYWRSPLQARPRQQFGAAQFPVKCRRRQPDDQSHADAGSGGEAARAHRRRAGRQSGVATSR